MNPADFSTDRYCHRQWSPISLLLFFVGTLMVLIPTLDKVPWFMLILFPIIGAMLWLLGFGMSHLRVADEGDRLLVQFGPLPLFKKTIGYDEIREASKIRTQVIDGWGIHYRLGRGWLWNLWGRDAIELELVSGKRFAIGTNDADRLLEMIAAKIRKS